MERVCFVFGGDSPENEISILTALKVHTEIEKYSMPHFLVYLDHDGNFYTGQGLLHKNNYRSKLNFNRGSFKKDKDRYYFKSGMKKDFFDYVILLSHGANAEDGTIGGYFDTLKIPCIHPGILNSSILQDKMIFKMIMDCLNIPIVRYQCVQKNTYFEWIDNKTMNLAYPLIVKPANQGSSIGVNKVNKEDELNSKIIEAFKYCDNVIIEEAIENLIEINVAAVMKNDEIILSQIERVNNENKVLSFLDKYDNYSFNDSHIIPADIDKKIAKKVNYLAKKIYRFFNLKTIVRFDFLYDSKKDELYINEINAIPGSLSYYLFEQDEVKMFDLINILIDQFKKDMSNKVKLITKYNDGFIDRLKAK